MQNYKHAESAVRYSLKRRAEIKTILNEILYEQLETVE